MHEETFQIESLFKQNPRALKSNIAHEKCPLTTIFLASTLLHSHLVSGADIMPVALASCQMRSHLVSCAAILSVALASYQLRWHHNSCAAIITVVLASLQWRCHLVFALISCQLRSQHAQPSCQPPGIIASLVLLWQLVERSQ